jgi:hypothetical protein
LKAAIEHITPFTADMSGNEEIQPLTYAFKMPLKKGYEKKIFFLTDGGVGDHSAVVNLVKSNAHLAKIYTFGIQCTGRDE